jgi:hypothetical protein
LRKGEAVDEVTRAVNLTKAEVLKINAAYLRILVDGVRAPRTYESLAAWIREAAADMEEQAREFRESVPVNPERN